MQKGPPRWERPFLVAGGISGAVERKQLDDLVARHDIVAIILVAKRVGPPVFPPSGKGLEGWKVSNKVSWCSGSLINQGSGHSCPNNKGSLELTNQGSNSMTSMGKVAQ